MSRPVRPLWLGMLLTVAVAAQGPGSCGFHLDLLTNDTSTHSAIADVPGAPGAEPGGIAPGALGNPYSAYASAGTQVTARIQAPAGTLANFGGSTPYGAGSVVSLFYAVGAPNLTLGPPGNALPGCTLTSWIVSILPLGGALVDGLGVVVPAPIFPPSDPGFPGSFQVTFNYPVTGAPPVNFQAVFLTPGGQIAVSNGASLLTGPSPHQTSVAFSPPTGCPYGPLDEGTGIVSMPPSFQFYANPTPTGVVRPNGVIEFGPQAGTGCPWSQYSGYACAPLEIDVAPRVAVNLVDNDLLVAPGGANLPDITVEYAGPTGSAPSRTIVRWKHVSPFFSLPGNAILTDDQSSVCEFWGADAPGGSLASASNIVVVRQSYHVGLYLDVYGGMGISPGDAGQGFGGPPPTCNNVDIWASWGGWYFTALPIEAILLNFNPTGSVLLSHMATVFTPLLPSAGYRVEAF